MSPNRPTRRDFLRFSAGAALLGPLAVCGRGRPARRRPNLLVLHTDEHNLRTLGCYRRTLSAAQAHIWGPDAVVETPHIDRLADEGALCTRFYATTPVCSPSRASWVSGRYPQNTPVTTNNIPLDNEIVTFAEILGGQGYATGYAGKWHLDGPGKPQWEPQRRFGFADNRYMFNRGHWKKLEDTPDGPRIAARTAKGTPSYDVAGADGHSFTTDFLADKTIAFVEAHRNEPFCYMVSFPDPHGPNSVRAPYDTMFENLHFEKPDSWQVAAADAPAWGKPARSTVSDAALARYFGMVKCIDDNVGRIVATLERLGLLDDTVVVFAADHGDLCGEHRRDNKGVPFEMSARIPVVLRYPPRVPAGTRVHEALSCVDFLPTVLSLLGVATAGREEGRDAAALLTTGRAPEGWQDVAFFRSTGGPDRGWVAAVNRRYKLIYAVDEVPWLFDLERDPNELTNAYRDPALRQVVRDLAAALRAYGRRHRDERVAQPSITVALEAAVGPGPL